MTNKQENDVNNKNVNQFNRYLNNNIEILHQKYRLYFQQNIPIKDLTLNGNLQKALQYIYDIFNFTKYQSNKKLNDTLKSSLIVNIKTYVKQTQLKQPGEFDPERAVKLLKYCIQNNDMFAVHYDKKQVKKQQTQQNVQVQTSQLPHQQQQQQLKKETQLQQRQQQIVKIPQQNAINPIQVPQKTQNTFNKMNFSNEFSENQKQKNQLNEQLIKKQLKNIFQFYCKQQQNIGPKHSFDMISHHCQTMNLGKFMAFANAANISHSKQKTYSQGKIDKATLINTFKKIAEGSKQIDFKIFSNIIFQLKKFDTLIYQKLGVGQSGIKGKTKIQQKFKYFSLPFNTRDLTARQILPHDRIFVPKITSHSGKYEDDLKIQLKLRRQMGRINSQQKKFQTRSFNKQQKQVKQIGQKAEQNLVVRIGNQDGIKNQFQDYNFLSNLVSQQDNDEIFLKQYRIPLSKGSSKQKQVHRSVDQQRYKKQIQTTDNIYFHKNKDNQKTNQNFVLPHIKNKGIKTQRKSIIASKNIGIRSPLF